MKILRKDLKNGQITVQAQGLDDLWHLSKIIGKGDKVTGKTTRKVRLGESEDAVKKTYTLSIIADGAEFKDQSLRIPGITAEISQDIPKGAHHTITAETGEAITITKEKWQRYQLERLEDATKEQLRAIIAVFDRENCIIAKLTPTGYEICAELKGKVKKKDYVTTSTNFYREIIEALKHYDERNKPEKIILASPSFWKDEMANELKNEGIAKKTVLAACSDATENAINEVMMRPEMEAILKNAAAAREMKSVEELMAEIAKEGKAAYGEQEVNSAIESGAADKLLITEAKVREKEQLLEKAEQTGAKIEIISSEGQAGEKLEGLGGIAAILRYKIRH